MAEKDTGAGMGDTGSKPGVSSIESLTARLKQVVSPALQTSAPASPEPVILEEHVVETTPTSLPVPKFAPPTPTPPKEAPMPQTSAPAPVPSTPLVQTPKIAPPAPLPQKPSAQATAEDVGLVLPKPSPQASISLTPKQMTAPPMPKSEDILPEKVLRSNIVLAPSEEKASLPPIAPAQSPMAAAPVSPGAAPTTPRSVGLSSFNQPQPSAAAVDLSNDIQRILSQVKLPERRENKGAADQKQVAEPPKDVPAMVTKPPTDAATARAMTKPEATAISSVHTLKDDLQHVVKEKKMSLVRAVALEQDRKRDEIIEEEFGRSERRKRVFGILFATFLLFGLGFAALFGVYFVMMSHAGTSAVQQNSIVFAEQSVALPLDNSQPADLKRRVAVARQGQVGSLGSITRIVPLYQATTQGAQPTPATTQQFFHAMGFNAPDDLLRSLDSNFFFGLHVVDKNAPVLVIPVTNYDHAFAAMLSWEPTMNTDLSPAFTPVPTTVLDANGIPSARFFQDDVMRNYDVRELKDDSGAVELYYSFPSKNLLIIAESPYSFPELLSRLQSVRRL